MLLSSCFVSFKQLFSSQADGSPLSVDQQLRGREKPKILHPIPHVGGKYKDQKIILLVPLIIIIYFCSYVGILSGYAISLVAWSWYTDCADCPKVLIMLTNVWKYPKSYIALSHLRISGSSNRESFIPFSSSWSR